MKIVDGSNKVPVIYTVHHASHDYREFDSRVALNTEQKVRFSDYGTNKTVPDNGIATIIAEQSRALGDLNRNPDDSERFQIQDYGRPHRHPIWKAGLELTDSDKEFCQENYYQPFHDAIVNQLNKRKEPTFVVAWDNTAHYEIGKDDSGNSIAMKPFILSNRGSEESANPRAGEQTSCDPLFLMKLSQHFSNELVKRGLPSEIHLNLVFKGGYICRRYSTMINELELRKQGVGCDVQSLQVEYDTVITHDQITLEEKPEKITALREAFSEAIEITINDYKNIG